MKALVTGAAGFIGSSIARRLLADGHEVLGVDCLTDYYDVALKRGNLAELESDGFHFVEADLFEAELTELVDVDVVFHEAGQAGVRASWGDEFRIYTRQNIDVTQLLLEAVRGSDRLKRFVYASSSSIYGDAERYPTTEFDLPQPVSPYGVTKLAAEHLVSLYAAAFGVPTVSLRYFTVYGPGQRPDMAFTRFCRAAVSGDALLINGDGTQVRDFTYVDDVVAANLLAATAELAPGSVFNVSGGSNATVLDAIALIERHLGNKVKVQFGPKMLGDVFQTGGSSELFHAATGWEPRVDLSEGLRRQLEWVRATA